MAEIIPPKEVIKYSTGAVRSSPSGKCRPGLMSPLLKERLGWWLSKGADLPAYGPRNWEKGIPLSRWMEGIEDHLLAIQLGHTDEDHEAALAFNVMGFLHTREMVKRGVLPQWLEDMPDYRGRRQSVPQPGSSSSKGWDRMPGDRVICLALDGVLRSERSSAPVPGAISFVWELLEAGYTPVVLATDVHATGNAVSLRSWLHGHGFPPIRVTDRQPKALLYLDARGMRFDGDFKSILSAIHVKEQLGWRS